MAGLTQYGNPVACAAAIASIKVYEEEGMIENSRKLGQYCLERLQEIKRKHPSVGDVRGIGLFAAIEYVKDRETREPMIPWTQEYAEKKHPLAGELLSRLKEDGISTYTRWSILMICPPLCITREEMDFALDAIDRASAVMDNALARRPASV